jgi:hypothetical protein|tara:strand:+ start:1501 stop:1839 length:339 start_codon:yes stop_codon:yes gene_type:complete
MNVSEVVDIDGSFQNSTAIIAGDKITIQGFTVKHVESLGSDVAEIKTTSGLRHSFGKAVVGQAKSEYWNDIVTKCIKKDASDGLDVYVVEREAEGTGRMMLSLSMFPPKAIQ